MSDLGEIIEALAPVVEKYPGMRVRHGFDPGSAHSWRGSYSELSFEPKDDVLLADMLRGLREALGKTFDGYKGGEFTMREFADVYIDPYGQSCGNKIGSTLIRYWTGGGA